MTPLYKRPRNWIQFVLGLSKPKKQTEQTQVHYHIHLHVEKEKSYQQVLAEALTELPLAVAPATVPPRVHHEQTQKVLNVPYEVRS